MAALVGDAADGDLRLGAWVHVVAVSSKPNLNGKTGIVIGFQTPEKRWPVSVSGGAYLFKAENLNGLADPVAVRPQSLATEAAPHRLQPGRIDSMRNLGLYTRWLSVTATDDEAAWTHQRVRLFLRACVDQPSHCVRAAPASSPDARAIRVWQMPAKSSRARCPASIARWLMGSSTLLRCKRRRAIALNAAAV